MLSEFYKNTSSKIGPDHPIMKLLKKVRQRHHVKPAGKLIPSKDIIVKRKITQNVTEILKNHEDTKPDVESPAPDSSNALLENSASLSQNQPELLRFLEKMRTEIRHDVENLTNQVRLVDGHIEAVITQIAS